MDYLEAIGLIKTFVKHEEQQTRFVYQLIQPYSLSILMILCYLFLYSEVEIVISL